MTNIQINTENDYPNSSQASDELVQTTIKRVNALLNQYFPLYMPFGDGKFAITRGSSQVMVSVMPFVRGETIVECTANVVTGAKITPDLMKFLLRKNAELHFGAFALLFDGTITFSHAIPGANLDDNELITALNSVAFVADYYDDVIVNMAGGKRASDLTDDFEL